MKESDDDEGMPSLVHDSSENSSGDEGKPRKGQPKKKKKKKKAPAPGSSDEEGDSGPQTGGAYPHQNPFGTGRLSRGNSLLPAAGRRRRCRQFQRRRPCR